MTVTVEPSEFQMVSFDAAEIAAIAERIMAALDLDTDLVISVNEATPLGHARIESLDPLCVYAESGALEDARRIRHLDPEQTADVLGRLLIRIADRQRDDFGPAPIDAELDLAHAVAWDAYAMGRLARMGHRSQRPRRRYHFLLRHGFTDRAEAQFDRLWNASDLSWADIVAISDRARAVAA